MLAPLEYFLDPVLYSVLVTIWIVYLYLSRMLVSSLMERVTHTLEKVTNDTLEQRRAYQKLQDELKSTNLALIAARNEVLRSERATQNLDIYMRLRHEMGVQPLDELIRHAGQIVANAPALTRVRIECRLDQDLMSFETLSRYLDSLNAHIAIVPGHTANRPLEIAMRHKTGWVLLHEGFHDLHLTDGRLTGAFDATIVPPAERPSRRPGARFGAHVNRRIGDQ